MGEDVVGPNVSMAYLALVQRAVYPNAEGLEALLEGAREALGGVVVQNGLKRCGVRKKVCAHGHFLD